MRILMSGATGLIGSYLVPSLEKAAHGVSRLTRSPEPGSGDVGWDVNAGTIDSAALEGFDAVIHLAGENLFGRWTPEKKARIVESRENGTRLISESLAKLSSMPKVLVSASAIGYYGDRGDEMLEEDSSPGGSFLSEVCVKWEDATRPAADAGIRVVNTRFGIVLTPKGGALEKMMTPFRLGLGGRIGSGRQYMSWIAIDDLCSAVQHVIAHEEISGPVNFVSPNPVTNKDFTRALAGALSKPAIFSVPVVALKAVYGEMADDTLLASQRVMPGKLTKSGFEFAYTSIDDALLHIAKG